MKTTYISRAKFGKFTAAIAAAALLAGTAAPGVLAADYTAQLTKTIDMTAAPGAGVPHGSITFTVGTVANLPSWAAGTAVKGTAAQIKSTELTAAFTGGTANTVTVPFTFDSDDFTAPGDYIFSLTETAAGITGLTQDTAARYIVVRVVNTDPTAPDGSLEISEVNIVNADGTAKAGEITNTYAAYGLSVVKHLSGNFANAGDEFTFTIALDDPDETPHASSVTVKTGGESADFSTITGDTVTFNADGTAEVKAGITGGEKIELTGLPANTGYTITESGDTASGYTTTWDGITKTGSDDKTSDAQTMAAADKTITVTNSRTAPTPTGLLLDAAPYGAMLLAAALLLGALALFGAWSLWDIAATRRTALPEQTLRFKPLAAAPADSPGFAELRALNPDVCGWLTLDGTRIDFPVVQGADNMVYVNTDVYGDFSLSGAIFLDSRCPADFTAPYSIVYGHHIEDGGMFGDIVQFTQSDYFAAHTTGTLITDDTAYNIALFACVRADAYDPVLYDPAQSPDALLAYIKAHAVQYRTPGSGPVVAFSTCTEAATNGRVLLFGQLLPQT